VRNAETGQRYSKLQAAIGAASAGDRIEVRGTCRGTTTVDRDLAIKGVWTTAWGRARLEGNRSGAFTLTVEPGVTLTLKSTTVYGNRADRDGVGGGLRNRGTTTFRGTHVRGPGYGTAVVNEGTLMLEGKSRIGDGVVNEGEMTVNHEGRIDGGWRGHSGPYPAYGVYNVGRLTLNDASGVVDNRADGVFNRGDLVLNDESRVIRNGESGVFNRGRVVMNEASRIARNDGPGVYIQRDGSLTMSGRSWVSRNQSARGAGVFLRSGTLTMSGNSRIRYNEARIEGGGLYVGRGTLEGVRCGPATDANVRYNDPQDCVFE
jgi:hypothetical protein